MKIYTKTFSTNYANIAKAQPALIVPSGKMVCFQVGFPSEGFLERLIVSQATGTPVGVHVELLNSIIPYAPGIYSSGASPADALPMYRIPVPITGPLTATSGNVLIFTDDDFGIGFRNIDGGWTLNQRYLYLLIDPQSAGTATSWNVHFQARTDIG